MWKQEGAVVLGTVPFLLCLFAKYDLYYCSFANYRLLLPIT